MTVHCFIEQKNGERHHFKAGCFGWMDIPLTEPLTSRAPRANYKETGAKVGYIVEYQDHESANKYIEYLKAAKLLEDVSLTAQKSDDPNNKEQMILEAVCSNELPGQEIVGKFELLRQLQHNYHKTLVELVSELRDYKNISSRYDHLHTLLSSYPIIIVAIYITRWFIVSNHPSGSVDCMPQYPSKSFLNLVRNCEQSRKVYKSWKDSGYFSGVYRYFSDAMSQEMSTYNHFDRPNTFRNQEDIQYTYLKDAPKALSVKEAVRVFSVNCANITRW